MKFFAIIKRFALPLAASVLLIWGIIIIQNRLLKTAQEKRLRFSDVSAQAIPNDTGDDDRAAIHFIQKALGSFRGLAADILWLRAERMKSEGRNFELVQLSRWIIDLQPNYAAAIAYLGWNLAYNISVTTSDPAERWRWVQEGIALFKERALLYNPDDPEIYRELAWIYYHKMGDTMDDAQSFYKLKQAEKMSALLGAKPDFVAMANAPKSKADFHRAFAANKADLWQDDANFDRFYDDLYLKFSNRTPASLPDDFLPGNEELRHRVDAALRAERIRRVEKLEPAKMLALNQKYGELDWRTAESQAVYWASLGVEADEKNALFCKRLLNDALVAAFRAGIIRIVGDNQIAFVPNFGIGDATLASLDQYEKECAYDAGFANAAHSKRINFLKNAVPLLYSYGLYREAEKYYRKLADTDDAYKKQNFEQYIFSVWKDEIRDNDVKQASAIINGLLSTSIQYLVIGQHAEALSYERMARYLYQSYMHEVGDNDRVKLPPYNDIKADITRFYLANLPPAQSAMLRQALELEAIQQENTIKPEGKKP